MTCSHKTVKRDLDGVWRCTEEDCREPFVMMRGDLGYQVQSETTPTRTPTRTYLVEQRGNVQRRVTVPEDWKVTFGPLAPGSKHMNGQEKLCLRMYETKEKQRAVFTDVVSFRDLSIPVEVRKVHKQEQRAKRMTPDGEKDFTVVAEYAEWRADTDEPSEFPKALRLPSLDDDAEAEAKDSEIEY